MGEHSMLDTDTIFPSERETTAGTFSPSFSHSPTDLQEGELKNEALLQEHDAGQHQTFGGKTFIQLNSQSLVKTNQF